MNNYCSLAAHTHIHSKYMQVGQAIDDGAVLVRRFGLNVRIAPIEDHAHEKLMRITVDVENWAFKDPRLKTMRDAVCAASNVISEGASVSRVFEALAKSECLKERVEIQQVFAVVERHLSWTYDTATNKRRICASPFAAK